MSNFLIFQDGRTFDCGLFCWLRFFGKHNRLGPQANSLWYKRAAHIFKRRENHELPYYQRCYRMLCVGGRNTHPRKINKASLRMPDKRFVFGIFAGDNACEMPDLKFKTTEVSCFLVACRMLEGLLHPSIVSSQEFI